MPTTSYLSVTYPTPLDAGTADVWGDTLNDGPIVKYDQALGRVQCSGMILYPENRQYTLVLKSRWPGTIKSLTVKTDTGTTTCNVKIDSTSVTSLSAVSATSSESTTSATGANTFTADQDISITLSSVSGLTALSYNLWIDRTGVGTA